MRCLDQSRDETDPHTTHAHRRRRDLKSESLDSLPFFSELHFPRDDRNLESSFRDDIAAQCLLVCGPLHRLQNLEILF